MVPVENPCRIIVAAIDRVAEKRRFPPHYTIWDIHRMAHLLTAKGTTEDCAAKPSRPPSGEPIGLME